MENERDILKQALLEGGFSPAEDQISQLLTYYRMLVEKNRVMNLTRVTDLQEAAVRHFADSLSLSAAVDPQKAETLMDLGTGAGFPGLPLKIMYPHLKVTMLDSVGKKVNFINEVIEALGLHDAIAVHGRAEDLARDRAHREHFDLCVSRAVANLSSLAEYCLPFVRVGGSFVAYKAEDCEEEAAEAAFAIREMGGDPAEILSYENGGMIRKLIVVKKHRATPGKYPRKAGMPSRNPLAG